MTYTFAPAGRPLSAAVYPERSPQIAQPPSRYFKHLFAKCPYFRADPQSTIYILIFVNNMSAYFLADPQSAIDIIN